MHHYERKGRLDVNAGSNPAALTAADSVKSATISLMEICGGAKALADADKKMPEGVSFAFGKARPFLAGQLKKTEAKNENKTGAVF